MQPRSPAAYGTRDELEAVAATLLGRSSRPTRSLLRTCTRELTRTEAGVFTTLSAGSRSIGELADAEAVTQPTMSKLVDSLVDRGLVLRRRWNEDGRVVLVSITPAGLVSLDRTVEHVRGLLGRSLCDLHENDLAVLVAAGEVLESLIQKVQDEKTPR